MCEQWGTVCQSAESSFLLKYLATISAQKIQCQESSPRAYTSPRDLVTNTQQCRCVCKELSFTSIYLRHKWESIILDNWATPARQPHLLAQNTSYDNKLPGANTAVAVYTFFLLVKGKEVGEQEHHDTNFSPLLVSLFSTPQQQISPLCTSWKNWTSWVSVLFQMENRHAYNTDR